MLSCIFHSEYDDRLEEMVSQCREASYQLYSYTQFKDINTNKLIDNSIFNIIINDIFFTNFINIIINFINRKINSFIRIGNL